MTNLKNRVALVTGASRGIGKAVALALAEAGVAVAVNYRERGEEARAVAQAIGKNGGRAAAFAADASVRTAVEGMVRQAEQQLGSIDILVNNAGMAAVRSLDDITEEDFDRALAVNLKSVFLCTQAVLPGMRARGWGRIVNISAMGARAGSRSIAYGASKAGLEGLTRSYALQLAPEGVTVNAVAPGLIDTDMARPLIEAGVAATRAPVGRVGTAEEIAQAVLLVAGNGYHDRPDRRGQRRLVLLLSAERRFIGTSVRAPEPSGNFPMARLNAKRNGLEFRRRLVIDHRIVARSCANFEGFDQQCFQAGVRARKC